MSTQRIARRTRARRLIIWGVVLLVIGLAVYLLVVFTAFSPAHVGGLPNPGSGPPDTPSDSAGTAAIITACGGLVTALAGLIAAVAGLIKVIRRPEPPRSSEAESSAA